MQKNDTAERKNRQRQPVRRTLQPSDPGMGCKIFRKVNAKVCTDIFYATTYKEYETSGVAGF
jgi:hypothetical protein